MFAVFNRLQEFARWRRPSGEGLWSGRMKDQVPVAEIRSWLFDSALPFWGSAGLDRQFGGFLEEVDSLGKPTDCAFKRVRVICRQVYVFSHAAQLGWRPGVELSNLGYAYLLERAWLGAERGWARRLTRQGEVLDPTPDLYDLAFVLFALAWRYRLTGERDVRDRADQTLQFIERELGAGDLGGFWHDARRQEPRLQNPHMHLLEACLALAEATGDDRYLRPASDIVQLFNKHFFDGSTLAEYFTSNWRLWPEALGRSREPGHHFEWAWILAQYGKLSGEAVLPAARALVDFAERCIDPQTGAVFDAVTDTGQTLRASSRTWPNTERIKGWLGLFELERSDPCPALAQSSRLLLDRYFKAERPGSWVDQFDASGQAISTIAPASTFYHVFLAFAELLRLAPLLEQSAGPPQPSMEPKS
jgi:mannose/cellobiose epimerase-like protein (N-acyl-D-glucosamine 2-epimerase family)